MPPQPAHLDPSPLGTRAYWDTLYTREATNFSKNPADEGEIWFSDAGAEERMLAFLSDLADEDVLHKEAEGDINDGEESSSFIQPTRFLDLGTGNGHLLFALREDGWEGEMVGVDYAAPSVELAGSIRDTKGEEYKDIKFYEFDILSSSDSAAPEWLGEGFDVVLDKGTFDAISLSEEKDAQGRRIAEGYREKVEGLVKKGGRFLITSCNWTEEEVRGWFEGGEMVFEGRAEYPSFTFGGKTGSSVCTLCFKRR
ncbi:S-adenosyl-L-methionine-dependent methyltransferase [Bimuria novae-zelandiae CBS 107.79]|uniref:Protein-lysine N-methyltransferase EFM4 n=1 Tax=Bimuria novae-zelandiae CBS 107.79 TaxID=1447943 RepID=A0A6A5UQC6_9PLEO|nr:S-adenosyl-L-methionine-dependent methyltransferase [Bimuria novae-zelandiae CBS 107.79]